MQIEYVDTNKLKPYADNAKVHTADQIEQIKKSIAEFGFNDPIAVWSNDEIIEGHGRLLAAMELGMQEVPIIRLEKLTDDERRAYMLVHNQLTMNTGFDYDVLDDEIRSLHEIDVMEYGFEPFDKINVADFYTEIDDRKEVVCSNCGTRFYVNKRGDVIE